MSDNNGWRHRVIERKRMRVGDLLPNKYNPVRHGANQKGRMQAVLDKFGIVTELIAYYKDDGKLTLFDGHLRQGLDPGQEWDVAITDLSQAECDELALYFDPLAGMSTPDGAVMTALMQDLQDVDGVLGEMLEELAADAGIAFADEPPEDPGAQVDKAAELQEKWQVERGQVWEIGRHRLMCGDSMDAGDVGRLMCGEKAQAVVTDPPYGVSHDLDYTRFVGGVCETRLKTEGILQGDDKIFDPRPLLDYESVVLWGGNFYGQHLPIGSWLVWDKRFKGGQAFLSDAELAWMKGGYGIYIFSQTSQGFVRPERVQHPTQKTVALIEWCMEKSKAGGTVYDPFLGSGTTLVACEQTGRIGYGMEIEPKYCAVTLDRLQRMGLEPRLVGG